VGGEGIRKDLTAPSWSRQRKVQKGELAASIGMLGRKAAKVIRKEQGVAGAKEEEGKETVQGKVGRWVRGFVGWG